MNYEPVIFRKMKDNGDILALFFKINYNSGETTRPGLVMSYQHVGQSGEADLQYCIKNSRPAKPAEYAELKAEIEKLNCFENTELKVYKRVQP